jgi:hypothetical protein
MSVKNRAAILPVRRRRSAHRARLHRVAVAKPKTLRATTKVSRVFWDCWYASAFKFRASLLNRLRDASCALKHYSGSDYCSPEIARQDRAPLDYVTHALTVEFGRVHIEYMKSTAFPVDKVLLEIARVVSS